MIHSQVLIPPSNFICTNTTAVHESTASSSHFWSGLSNAHCHPINSLRFLIQAGQEAGGKKNSYLLEWILSNTAMRMTRNCSIQGKVIQPPPTGFFRFSYRLLSFSDMSVHFPM